VDVFLKTGRLTLRPFTADDVEVLVELDSDPEVMRFLSGGAPTSRHTIETRVLPRFMAGYAELEGPGYWAALAADSNEFLGWFAVHPVHDRPGEFELGYRLRRSAWGRGLATEGSLALLHEGFRRAAIAVFAQTYEDNIASRRVMEKLGMRFVREFKVSDEALREGTFDAGAADALPGDDVEYAITSEEWRSLPGVRDPCAR